MAIKPLEKNKQLLQQPVEPELDPSPVGSGNWIGNWQPEEINNIANLSSLLAPQDSGMIAEQNAAIRSRDEQLAMINGQDLDGLNEWQKASLSALGPQREAEANRDFQINELRNSRNNQQKTLERNTADDIAARRATFQPELNKLKAMYNARGILNSSSFDDAVSALQGGIDEYAQKAQRELQDRLSTINETFNSRVLSLGNTYQTKIDNIQNLLTQRLDTIEKSRAATSKAKLQARMDVMKDHQTMITKIKKEYEDKAANEEKQRQQEFDNEVKMANLTGIFRGRETLATQKFAADEAYRQQQLALAIMKANKGTKKSSSSSSSSLTSSNPLAEFYTKWQQKVASGINPKTAETQVVAMVSGTKNKAALREMIEGGPAVWEYAEGPVMPGEESPLASPSDSESWADFVNPKSSKGNKLTPEELALVEKFFPNS